MDIAYGVSQDEKQVRELETRAEWVVKGSGSVTVSADFARAG